jgi:hypothetical protein
MDRSIFVKYLSTREALYRAILLLRIIQRYGGNRWCESQLRDLSSKIPEFTGSFQNVRPEQIKSLIKQLLNHCPSWDIDRNPIFSIPKLHLDRISSLADAVAIVDTDWTLYLLGQFKYTPFQIRSLGLASINSEISVKNLELADLLLSLCSSCQTHLEEVEISIKVRLNRLFHNLPLQSY